VRATSGEEDPGEWKANREPLKRRVVQWKRAAHLGDEDVVAAVSVEALEVAADSVAVSEEALEAEVVADSEVAAAVVDVAEVAHVAAVVAESLCQMPALAKAQLKITSGR